MFAAFSQKTTNVCQGIVPLSFLIQFPLSQGLAAHQWVEGIVFPYPGAISFSHPFIFVYMS
jgi:hypothetical protein